MKGCEKYNKTVDEIVHAASKHREKLLALKDISDSQKEKIFCLRGHRNELFDKIDKINSEHAIVMKEKDERFSSLEEENESLKEQLCDQKEELEIIKLRDIESLKEKILIVPEQSLADELEDAKDEQKKEDLRKELKVFKTKVDKLEQNKDEKNVLFKHLLELSNQRTEKLAHLKASIEQIGKVRKLRCRFG